MTTATPPATTRIDKFLNIVERGGNKLPEPFILFTVLFLITAVITTGMAWAGTSVQLPGSEEVTAIRGLFTGEGLAWLSQNLGANYIGFPPLLTVITILLAVGIAEKTGLLSSVIRVIFGSAPRWALPYAVGFVGVAGNIMADSAFVIIPPLAAMVFAAAGRHPVAGLLGGFAATGAGYSTSPIVGSIDALFAGITSAVTETLPNPGDPVNPVSNYFFAAISALVLSLLAGFIIDKVLEPRLVRQGVPTTYADVEEDDDAPADAAAVDAAPTRTEEGTRPHAAQAGELSTEMTSAERRGLVAAVVAGVAVAALLLLAVLVPDSPYRNPEGAFLPESPLLSSIVFIVFVMFAVPGVVYGLVARTITSAGDVPRLMGLAIRDMTPFLVLAFILGQFIALFNWSGIGQWIALAGANGLEAINLTGYPAIIGFVLLASVLNLFIVSGSSLWTLMASVFVPLFALLGYEPAFTQAAFRIGDSATQVITPLNPYMVVLLGFLRRYEPDAGLGTLIARMLPFVIPFWITWVLILSVFFFFDLPIGPGNGIMID